MWQSLVEIGHYSIASFDHITAFEALYHSYGGLGQGSYALHRLIRYSCIYGAHMTQPLTEVLLLQGFERGKSN